MEQIRPWLPFLIPILILQLGLMILALMDLVHRERVKGPKWLWALIILFGELLGPILYFVIGREE